jgi:hypothetical protein
LGIETEIVPARCHESNGLIERLNRNIQEKVRALLISACFPDAFWNEAALHAVHLYNLTPHSKLKTEHSDSPSLASALASSEANDWLIALNEGM